MNFSSGCARWGLFSMLLVAACHNREGYSEAELSVRQENNQCPTVKRGTGLSGAPCFTHADCAENCCLCGDGTEYAAALCSEGLCALPSASCKAGLSQKSEVCAEDR